MIFSRYGDFTPQTVFGRVIMAITMFVGLIIGGLIFAIAGMGLQMNNMERRMVSYIKRKNFGMQRRTLAAKTIQAVWRKKLAERKGRMTTFLHSVTSHNHMKMAVKSLSQLRQQKMSAEEDILTFRDIDMGIHYLKKDLDERINRVDERIEGLEKNGLVMIEALQAIQSQLAKIATPH